MNELMKNREKIFNILCIVALAICGLAFITVTIHSVSYTYQLYDLRNYFMDRFFLLNIFFGINSFVYLMISNIFSLHIIGLAIILLAIFVLLKKNINGFVRDILKSAFLIVSFTALLAVLTYIFYGTFNISFLFYFILLAGFVLFTLALFNIFPKKVRDILIIVGGVLLLVFYIYNACNSFTFLKLLLIPMVLAITALLLFDAEDPDKLSFNNITDQIGFKAGCFGATLVLIIVYFATFKNYEIIIPYSDYFVILSLAASFLLLIDKKKISFFIYLLMAFMLIIGLFRAIDYEALTWVDIFVVLPIGALCALGFLLFKKELAQRKAMVDNSMYGQNPVQPEPQPVNPTPVQPLPVNPTPVQPQPANDAVPGAQELIQLKQLLDQGIINQEDYDAKKKQILGL